MWWSQWWVWMIFATALGVLEVLAPTQIFLGFAIGALAISLGLLMGIPGLSGSLATLLIVGAVIALVAWLVLRQVLGVRKGQTKVFEHDINED